MSASDDARRLADRISELERALHASEVECERLAQENSEQCDRIFALQCAAKVAGMGEQAKNALLMAERYMREEGDDLTSERVRACVLQAIETVAKAAEIQAAAEAA